MELEELNKTSEVIIGYAIEVHKILGPGLLESIYETALCYEFNKNHVTFKRQYPVPVIYKGATLGEHRLDILVQNEIILELKAVDRFDPVFDAQLLSYLKLARKKLGLLINFNVPILRNGIKRLVC